MSEARVLWSPQPRQRLFMSRPEDEALYGGAAGGGKSFGQILDAHAFAVKYPGSKQLILRRTMPELESEILSGKKLRPERLTQLRGAIEEFKKTF